MSFQSSDPFAFDYEIIILEEEEERYISEIEFKVLIKAKAKNFTLFKISLTMEGIFIGNPKQLFLEKFREMVEIEGIATLSQLYRAYVLSVSALSGINTSIKLLMINVFPLREKKIKITNSKICDLLKTCFTSL